METEVNQEREQLHAERVIYDMVENKNFDFKTDYEKGINAFKTKLNYMPNDDFLSKNESFFLAHYYPELLSDYENKFNWSQASSEFVKWGEPELIKKHFANLNLRGCADSLRYFQPELFESLSHEINRKLLIEPGEIVPQFQLEQVIEGLKKSGFSIGDEKIVTIQDAIRNKELVLGTKLIDILSNVKGQDGYLEGIEFDYSRGQKLLNQCGLTLNEKKLDFIKVNQNQHIKLPILGAGYAQIKENLETLLKGQQSSLINGFKIKGDECAAKLTLVIDQKSGKYKIKSDKKAKELNIPEELTADEKQKLKNGERIKLREGFMKNYRYSNQKTSFLMRNLIAQQKIKAHQRNEVEASLRLDKELNRLVVEYIIGNKEKAKINTVVATISANGDNTDPSVSLRQVTNINPNNPEEKANHAANLKKVNGLIHKTVTSVQFNKKIKRDDPERANKRSKVNKVKI